MHPTLLSSLAAALLVGLMIAAQPGINAQLSARLGSPLQASLVSFLVGTLALALVALTAGPGLPRPAAVFGAPAWLWLGGGLLGATFVTTAVIVAPRVGAANWIALVVAGQMLGSLALDHFGWLGFRTVEVSPSRWLGLALVVGGVLLVARK
jgi:transporter family-2 protein